VHPGQGEEENKNLETKEKEGGRERYFLFPIYKKENLKEKTKKGGDCERGGEGRGRQARPAFSLEKKRKDIRETYYPSFAESKGQGD